MSVRHHGKNIFSSAANKSKPAEPLIAFFGSFACFELFATAYFTSMLIFKCTGMIVKMLVFLISYFPNMNFRIQSVEFFVLSCFSSMFPFLHNLQLASAQKSNFFPDHNNIDLKAELNIS